MLIGSHNTRFKEYVTQSTNITRLLTDIERSSNTLYGVKFCTYEVTSEKSYLGHGNELF